MGMHGWGGGGLDFSVYLAGPGCVRIACGHLHCVSSAHRLAWGCSSRAQRATLHLPCLLIIIRTVMQG